MSLVCTGAGAQTWQDTIAVRSAGSAQPIVLRIGQHPAATAGIDAALGEVELPPLAPLGSLDVRFVGPALGNGTHVVILPSSASRVDTLALWTQPAGGRPIVFTWNARHLAAVTRQAVLRDAFGGRLGIEVDMHRQSRFELADARITGLQLLLQAADPADTLADDTSGPVVVIPWARLKGLVSSGR